MGCGGSKVAPEPFKAKKGDDVECVYPKDGPDGEKKPACVLDVMDGLSIEKAVKLGYVKGDKEKDEDTGDFYELYWPDEEPAPPSELTDALNEMGDVGADIAAKMESALNLVRTVVKTTKHIVKQSEATEPPKAPKQLDKVEFEEMDLMKRVASVGGIFDEADDPLNLVVEINNKLYDSANALKSVASASGMSVKELHKLFFTAVKNVSKSIEGCTEPFVISTEGITLHQDIMDKINAIPMWKEFKALLEAFKSIAEACMKLPGEIAELVEKLSGLDTDAIKAEAEGAGLNMLEIAKLVKALAKNTKTLGGVGEMVSALKNNTEIMIEEVKKVIDNL